MRKYLGLALLGALLFAGCSGCGILGQIPGLGDGDRVEACVVRYELVGPIPGGTLYEGNAGCAEYGTWFKAVNYDSSVVICFVPISEVDAEIIPCYEEGEVLPYQTDHQPGPWGP